MHSNSYAKTDNNLLSCTEDEKLPHGISQRQGILHSKIPVVFVYTLKVAFNTSTCSKTCGVSDAMHM